MDGGWVCLDFINTVHDRTVENPFEYLSGYPELLVWCVKVGILTSERKTAFDKKVKENREEAERILEDFIKAREILYSFFLPIAQNRVPGKKLQKQLNVLLNRTMGQLELEVVGKQDVHQKWRDKSSLEYPLNPIIKSAYDLLTQDLLDRVKECGACGWLFLDQSKNKSRKWCSMENCGSNVKAKRYYHRNKKKKEK